MSTKNENVVDDWECIDDSELNTKVRLLKKSATNNTNTESASDQCSRPFAAMILNDDDCMRTQYVPPEPTVKILKRPTNDKHNQQLLAEKPKAPIKTLQQREQEYAEARLRILGSAKSAEDEQEEAAAATTSTTPAPPHVNNIRNGFSNPIQMNGYSNRIAMNGGGGTAPNGMINGPRQYNRNYQPQQYHNNASAAAAIYNVPPEIRRMDDNVIRLPRGPDGSTGFMLKR